MTELQAEKYALIEELMKSDNVSLLREVKTILKGSNEIVAVDEGGKALTKSQMQIDLLKAKQRILSGEYISQEDFEKEAENWE